MDNTDKKQFLKVKRMYILSIISCALAILTLVSVSIAWFAQYRELDSLTWIKTPVTLDIGSGHNHDIAYLDMGNIDSNLGYKEYVFCVYGEPIDIYSLQLAYTTNIAFYYDIYRATNIDEASYVAEEAGNVLFNYSDTAGEHTEYFLYDPSTTPVISAKPLNQLTESEIKEHQSHSLSYGDEEGENAVSPSKVHSNAEPLYWLASENGVNVINPQNKGTKESGEAFFCDYYVIKVYWDPGTVVNDKETDIVYLTTSR